MKRGAPRKRTILERYRCKCRPKNEVWIVNGACTGRKKKKRRVLEKVERVEKSNILTYNIVRKRKEESFEI